MPLTRALEMIVTCVAVLLAAAALPSQAIAQQQGSEGAFAVDVNELTVESQQQIRGAGNAGVVWWIPLEFWLASGMPAAQLDGLREYTIVAVAAGKVGSFGGITFTPGGDIRARTVLRDAGGKDYSPLAEISADAESLRVAFKPILASIIGRLGENTEMLFFPAKNPQGSSLFDPKTKGRFSIVLKNFPEPGEHVYEWQLPLTSLLAPKYCPIGKEKVMANWSFCPWHGNALSDSAAAAQ